MYAIVWNSTALQCSVAMSLSCIPVYILYMVAKNVSNYQMMKKSYQIVLKPVIEIRFISQIKVWIKRYNIISWY